MRGFDFLSPPSLTAALRAIEGRGRTYKIIAGGTNVIPNLRDGTIQPRLVVDLGDVKALRYIKEANGWIKIGAMTTISELRDSGLIKRRAPVLWEATHAFAGPLVRNRATIGGNLADASPAADTAVPLLALNARVRLRRIDGRRTIPLNAFFAGYRKTAMKPGEILTEIAFPVNPQGTKYGYHKLGRRNAMAVSVASVAVVLHMRGKTCVGAAVSMGAVASTPIRVKEAEALLKRSKVDPALAAQCGELAARKSRPIDDMRASADYRRTVCGTLVRRAICQSLGLEDQG
ncbi:MAG: xanthine dehydrogenase family protein subunit M [Deltaproteobacteria bacterium]|nr:xanthine dehydrogenase family protein subunit M [Deltaproteobacteria bacterium]MBW2283526.1 xanthine dehydrogenase family protein subunit M [Deltaproteobacteria bacterium]